MQEKSASVGVLTTRSALERRRRRPATPQTLVAARAPRAISAVLSRAATPARVRTVGKRRPSCRRALYGLSGARRDRDSARATDVGTGPRARQHTPTGSAGSLTRTDRSRQRSAARRVAPTGPERAPRVRRRARRSLRKRSGGLGSARRVVSEAFATGLRSARGRLRRLAAVSRALAAVSARAAVVAARGALFAASSAPRATPRRPPVVLDESRGGSVNAVGGRSEARDAPDRRRGGSAAS